MYPEELLYSKDHEWVKVDGEVGTVGITHHAQKELGDIVYVEMPEAGSKVSMGDEVGTIESVKAVSPVYSPAAGEVTEVNAELDDAPELVNQEPYGKGWLFRIRLAEAGEPQGLMKAAEYEKLVAAAE